jgi:hypothetical protein
MEAASTFEHSRGVRFSTYATLLIRRAISHALDAERGRHLGVSVSRNRKLHRVRDALKERLGRQPTHNELAKALEVDVVEVMLIEQALQEPVHLDGLPYGMDTLVDSGVPSDGQRADPRRENGVIRSSGFGQVSLDEPIISVELSDDYSLAELESLIKGYESLHGRLMRPGRTLQDSLLVRMADVDGAITRLPIEDYLAVYEHGLVGHSTRSAAQLIGGHHNSVAYRYRKAVERIAKRLNNGEPDRDVFDYWVPVWRDDLDENWVRDAPFIVLLGRLRVRIALSATADSIRSMLSILGDWATQVPPTKDRPTYAQR